MAIIYSPTEGGFIGVDKGKRTLVMPWKPGQSLGTLPKADDQKDALAMAVASMPKEKVFKGFLKQFRIELDEE